MFLAPMQVAAFLQILSEPFGACIGAQFFVVLAGVPDSLDGTTGGAKELIVFPVSGQKNQKNKYK